MQMNDEDQLIEQGAILKELPFSADADIANK